jgi:glycosyltransferase involved in cell wall biosynthesis
VQLTGQVSGAFKNSVLSVADVALNPLTLGSGTNLKMLEYFVAGIPVISTPFGARGLGVTAGEHYLEAAVLDFPGAMDALVAMPDESVDALVRSARRRVEEHLSWDAIARDLLAELQRRDAAAAHPTPAVDREAQR